LIERQKISDWKVFFNRDCIFRRRSCVCATAQAKNAIKKLPVDS
jgi:hypothetical protein